MVKNMKSKLNNKGFIASAVLYVMLGLFITLMLGVIAIYSNRKILMDAVKKEVTTQLEADNKVGHLVGTREEYFYAATEYLALTDKELFVCNKKPSANLISVKKLINVGFLPNDIVSPITNRKENSDTQDNYILAEKQGSKYVFTYLDNATAHVVC